jgi:hypothetical protein
MSKRDSYEKISISEFRSQLGGDIEGFETNIRVLSEKYGIDRSFPEWYETFAAWLEVGTTEEEMMYHRMDNCYNSGCKICFK